MNLKRKKNKTKLLFLVTLFINISFILAAEQTNCLNCHLKENNKKRIDLKDLKSSIHRDLNCIDCHGELSYPHKETGVVNCNKCHEKESANYNKSTHGKASAEGVADAPGCSTCHGTHSITKLSKTKIPEVCQSCHSDKTIEEKYKLPGIEFIQAYKNSVHGKAVFSLGLINAPVCSTCHNSHLVLPPDDPASTIFRKNIPELCGKCHSSEKKDYMEGIHGAAIQKNIKEAPVCTDCHGEHTISVVTDPNSKVAPKNLPNTCSNCHDNVALAEKFAFKTKRFTTYLNTFHGVANAYGSTTVANCASCHEYHLILPSSDPRSPINPQNIPKTCGKCHPGAGINFAKGPVHVEAVPEVSKPAYYVRTFYKWFIGILCFLFIIHIMVDYTGYRRKKKSFEKEIKIDENEKP